MSAAYQSWNWSSQRFETDELNPSKKYKYQSELPELSPASCFLGLIEACVTKSQPLKRHHISTALFIMYSLFFFFCILAILYDTCATPVANTLDSSDFVTNNEYMNTDSNIIAHPDCGGLMVKCCLGRFNPVTNYVGPPCGNCNVPHILSIPRFPIN